MTQLDRASSEREPAGARFSTSSTSGAAGRFKFWFVLASALVVCFLVNEGMAGESASPAAALMRLLRSGRLPKERQGLVVRLVCERGTPEDLQYIFNQILDPKAFTPQVRRTALKALVQAARNRKVCPAGDMSRLSQLLHPGNPGFERRLLLDAVELAGACRVSSVRSELAEIALADTTSDAVRQAALAAISRLNREAGLAVIRKLLAPSRPHRVRFLAVAALARQDVSTAAREAAKALATASDTDDPGIVMAAFLGIRGGADELARSLDRQPPPADVAKLALRYLYSVGRSDARLVEVLSKAAGISTTSKPLSDKEIEELVAESLAHGDPARGEMVFRRADLSCMKCHSLNGAGGHIGPDLRDVGSSSPPDYLLRSVLTPELAVKEEFLTSKILTVDGQIFQGIVVDENDTRVVLKDATGSLKTIPTADIEQRVKGGTLMPAGLVNLMTRRELIDLVRFLSELGKPGPYAVRFQPMIRSWRVLRKASEDLVESVPDEEAVQEKLLNVGESAWSPVYSKVSGELPLDELVRETGQEVVYVQAELEVKAAGPITLRLNSPAGLHLWLDENPVPVGRQVTLDLEPGRHRLTFRIDTRARKQRPLSAEIRKARSSTAEVRIVAGP